MVNGFDRRGQSGIDGRLGASYAQPHPHKARTIQGEPVEQKIENLRLWSIPPWPPRNNATQIDPVRWSFLICVLNGISAEYWDPRGGDV
jgi:hypothetical protein